VLFENLKIIKYEACILAQFYKLIVSTYWAYNC